MEKFSLNEYLQTSKTVNAVDRLPDDFLLEGISIDSRTIEDGDLFIAIVGENHDGHRFVGEAVRKGAKGVVIRKDYPDLFNQDQSPLISVEDTTRFLMELAGWYRSHFTIPVFALTGSNGKTTTKEMLASVLGSRYHVTKTEKNLNNFIGVSLTLFQIDSRTECAVIELGTNHPGEIAALTQIVSPTHAAITNIGVGHIGFFDAKENIYHEKKQLFDNMAPGSLIYLNKEDDYLKNYNRSDLRMKTWGLAESCDYVGSYAGMNETGCVRFSVNELPEIQLNIPGKHQLMNAILAVTVGLDFGITAPDIQTALESQQAPDKRMETFKENGILYINDSYNANPESVQAAIDHLCHLPLRPGRKRFCILGDMLELGQWEEQAHFQIGEYLAGKPVDYVLCYGPLSRFVVKALQKSADRSLKTHWFDSHRTLASYLRKCMKPGDVVLLKGSRGMAMEKILHFLHRGGSSC